ELLYERLCLLSDVLDIVGWIDECGRSLLLALVRDDGSYLWWSGVPLMVHSDLKRLPIALEEYLIVMDIGDAVAFDGVTLMELELAMGLTMGVESYYQGDFGREGNDCTRHSEGRRGRALFVHILARPCSSAYYEKLRKENRQDQAMRSHHTCLLPDF